MNKADVAKGLQFNCPKCNVGIGKECLSKAGTPMSSYVHHGRAPIIPKQQYTRHKLEQWLKANAHILTDIE